MVCSGGPINSSDNIFSFSFLNYINNIPWHYSYNGENGYVISNNPITDNNPKFYNYSCSLGTDNKIYGQEINKFGLKSTYEI
jgi:hypothetical protein